MSSSQPMPALGKQPMPALGKPTQSTYMVLSHPDPDPRYWWYEDKDGNLKMFEVAEATFYRCDGDKVVVKYIGGKKQVKFNRTMVAIPTANGLVNATLERLKTITRGEGKVIVHNCFEKVKEDEEEDEEEDDEEVEGSEEDDTEPEAEVDTPFIGDIHQANEKIKDLTRQVREQNENFEAWVNRGIAIKWKNTEDDVAKYRTEQMAKMKAEFETWSADQKALVNKLKSEVLAGNAKLNRHEAALDRREAELDRREDVQVRAKGHTSKKPPPNYDWMENLGWNSTKTPWPQEQREQQQRQPVKKTIAKKKHGK